MIDISPPIAESTPVWPGDTAFNRAVTSDLGGNDAVTINRITTTPHIGAHADAPAHTRIDGAPIGSVPLEPYLGEALVVDMTGSAVPPASSPSKRRWSDSAAICRNG
ncbi:hypothetical protein GCM10020255_032090 [Rhodococcus baikonurensis]